MCDCYIAECTIPDCKNRLSVHIGDFSVPRESVYAFCPDCTERFFLSHKGYEGREFWKDCSYSHGIIARKVFLDRVGDKGEIMDAQGTAIGKKKQLVIFLVDSKRGYDIHLN